MRFDTEATGVETSAEQAAAAGHGVCQDFTHIFIAAARHLGIPARYVSGHLFRRDGQHDQEAAHAWAEGLGRAISAGSPSIRSTASAPTTPMSASPAGSTIATPRRSPAHVRVAASEQLTVEVEVSEAAARRRRRQSQN